MVVRKEAEFYHNIDRKYYLVWSTSITFIAFPGPLMASISHAETRTQNYRVLLNESCYIEF